MFTDCFVCDILLEAGETNTAGTQLPPPSNSHYDKGDR